MRKFKILVQTLPLFILYGFCGGNDELKIWTQQAKIDKAIDFEKSISKKIAPLKMKVSLSKSIYPLVDKYKIAKPVIIQRE